MTYLILCALLMLTACSEAIDTLPEQQTPAEAVAFTAYLNRTTDNTRGGQTGAIDITALRRADVGFGVFAFLGDDDRLYTSGTQMPDFMYNQKVCGKTTDNTTWEYSPLKYWPNETGSDAVSTNTDRLSFFAYAPYVGVNPETGLLTDAYSDSERTTGIVALSSHHHRGDPWVQYAVTYVPAKQVDLCWAEVNDNTLNQTKHTVAVAANAPGRIALNFRHALSSLNVQIDAIMDALTTEGSSALDGNTRIYVRSVSFEGFAASGALNLYNRVSTPAPVPRWTGNYGQGLLSMDPVTIYDGRRDRHEGSGANANEWPTGLNSAVVQTGAYTVDGKTINNTATPEGVTASAVNLFTPPGTESLTGTDEEKKAKQLAAPLYVIPNGQPLRVTVAYDVETYDPQLVHQRLSDDVTYGSSVPNVISSWVRMDGKELVLEAGKKYTIKLHLGMTSVKVDVLDVKPWEDGVDVNVVIPDAPAEP